MNLGTLRDMAKRGPAYPITDDWLAHVRARMAELAISQAELARLVDTSEATLSLLLRGKLKQSALIPEIHKALKWMPPLPVGAFPIASSDTHTVFYLYDALDKEDREAISQMIKNAHAAKEARQAKKLAGD